MDWEKQDSNRISSPEQIERNIASSLSTTDLIFWRLNLLYSTKENIYPPVFVIRGHHLVFYKRLLEGQSPYQITESILTDGNGDYKERDIYTEDLSGTNPLDQYVTHTLIQATFERYKKLPPDTMVLINTTYDHICNSCKIGVHCRVMDPEGRGEDGLGIWEVYQEALRQGASPQECSLTVTPLEIPIYQGIKSSAILDLSITKGLLDRSLSSVRNIDLFDLRNEWPRNLELMKNFPNIIYNPAMIWSFNEHGFVSKQ